MRNYFAGTPLSEIGIVSANTQLQGPPAEPFTLLLPANDRFKGGEYIHGVQFTVEAKAGFLFPRKALNEKSFAGNTELTMNHSDLSATGQALNASTQAGYSYITFYAPRLLTVNDPVTMNATISAEVQSSKPARRGAQLPFSPFLKVQLFGDTEVLNITPEFNGNKARQLNPSGQVSWRWSVFPLRPAKNLSLTLMVYGGTEPYESAYDGQDFEMVSVDTPPLTTWGIASAMWIWISGHLSDIITLLVGSSLGGGLVGLAVGKWRKPQDRHA